MTLKQLETELVEKYDYHVCSLSGYCIKRTDITHNIYDEHRNYLASICWKKGKLSFNDVNYIDVDKMIADIHAYNETLPYIIDSYDPTLIIGGRVEKILHNYLVSIGLKYDAKSQNSSYVLTDIYDRSIVKLSYKIDDFMHKESGKLWDNSVTNGGIIYSEFKNVEEAIAAINSLVKSKCLVDIAKEIKLLDGLSDKCDYNALRFMNHEGDSCELKEVIKEKLQEALDSL